jgi:carboxypeptidase C (cathepsin A)
VYLRYGHHSLEHQPEEVDPSSFTSVSSLLYSQKILMAFTELSPLLAHDARRRHGERKPPLVKLIAQRLVVAVVATVAFSTLLYAGFGINLNLTGVTTPPGTPQAILSSADVGGADWFCGEKDFEADYIKLANKKDDYYFYWFVRSRSETASTDPLVIWLNGGPGASSLEGLLTENGPCLVQPNVTATRNAYAWNNNANVIWLEQPSGVGFSYFTDDADRDATGSDVGANMIAFLDGFLDKHPEFVGRALYLTGESYAGHYIPAAAYAIWKHTKALPADTPKRINLQGIAIGNGDPHLSLQYKYSVEMAIDNAYNLTLLNDTQITQMRKDADECAVLLDTCTPYEDSPTGCEEVAGSCDAKILEAYFLAGRNYYDIRQPCSTVEECADTDGGVMERFLASDAVRRGLFPRGERRLRGSSGGYVSSAFLSSGDWAHSYQPELAELLNDGLRILIFAGDADLVCNWIGNRAWTLAIEWQGKHGFTQADEVDFVVPKDPLGVVRDDSPVVGGTVRQFENFAFLRVFNAGHLVPKNQPVTSWVMLDRFLKNEKL